jgi:PEP-CTERM motif
MAGFRRWPFGSVLGLALICVTPAGSQASPILDQSQTIIGDRTFTCAGTPTTFSICGQSFTVGLTGTLTSVEFYLSDAVGTPEAGIYTDVSGSGAILAQTSPTVLAFGGDGFYSFVFNYAVSTGDVLFFGLLQESGDAMAASFAEPDLYVPGGLFGFVPPNLVLTFPSDTAFRTFVDTEAVPEPATLTLLSVGLAGMGVRRWRHKAS